MRATGIPSWMVAITVSTAPCIVSNEQTAADTASGTGCSLQRHLGDDAERAFGSDEQARQVVARGRLAGPRARLDDAAVGEDDGQAEDVLAHRAVANRGRAGGARRGHAAERGVGAGIDGEHEAGVAQGLGQLQAGDAGFHRGVEILGADAQHAVHLAQVDADAAADRVHVPFERGAGAERNDRQLKALADAHDLRRPRRSWRGSRRCRARRAGDRTRRDCDVREPRRRPTRATPSTAFSSASAEATVPASVSIRAV